jgi:hypothetical protein
VLLLTEYENHLQATSSILFSKRVTFAEQMNHSSSSSLNIGTWREERRIVTLNWTLLFFFMSICLYKIIFVITRDLCYLSRCSVCWWLMIECSIVELYVHTSNCPFSFLLSLSHHCRIVYSSTRDTDSCIDDRTNHYIDYCVCQWITFFVII